MMLRPQLAFDAWFDADGDGAKHGEAVAGAIIACVRKQLLETMAECGMDGAQADAALDVLLERTQILSYPRGQGARRVSHRRVRRVLARGQAIL